MTESNAPDLKFLTAVSAEEAAAVTAVLLAALADRGEPAASAGTARDAGRWLRSAGAMRSPFRPGPGRWNALGR